MNTQQKPTLILVIAWMTLASGIVNLFWGFAASGAVLATVVGIICTPLTILPTILGVFELIYAAKLFSNPPQTVKPSTNIAIFEVASVLTFNVFSMAVGILSLVFYNDAVVKDYFARLNGTLAPEPVTPPAPASLPDPEPAPVIEEPIPPLMEEAPVPAPEETPEKPKRAPRKIAKN
ncbi:MAG: hypothetical protein IPP66_22625 [Anaerolineales bacterium]|nr:hypothetical protein [Anaerolineales bacterium]